MSAVFKRILVGCNGTPEAEDAVEVAIGLAAGIGAKVVLLGVATPPSAESQAEGYGLEDPAKVKQRLHEQLTRLAGVAKEQGVEAVVEVVDGDAEEQLERHATDEHADLIVVGWRHVSQLRHWLEHSTSEALLRRATTSVLVVRSPEKK